MEREVLKLTPKEARLIVIDNVHNDFVIIEDNVDDENAYNEFHEIVIKRLSDSKFFKTFYNLERKTRYGVVDKNEAYTDESMVQMNEVFQSTKIIYI